MSAAARLERIIRLKLERDELMNVADSSNDAVTRQKAHDIALKYRSEL